MEKIRRVANFILINDKNQVLIQHRTDNAPIYPSYFGLFGGKIEEGESPRETAIRECAEELGYKMLEPKLVLHEFHDSEYGKREKFIYAEEYNDSQRLILNEGQGMKWVDMDELETLHMIPHDRHYLLQAYKTNFTPTE